MPDGGSEKSMLIEPMETRKGEWMIVSNPRPMTAGGVRADDDEPEPVFMAWDWCWTGDSWTSAVARAEKFASRDAAHQYIEKHAEVFARAFNADVSDDSRCATAVEPLRLKASEPTLSAGTEPTLSAAIKSHAEPLDASGLLKGSVVLAQIHYELRRLAAETVGVREARPGGSPIPLVRVELDHKWCSLGASGFLTMLQSLGDGAGAQAVRRAIRSGARHGSDWATS